MAWKQYAIIEVHNSTTADNLLIKFPSKSMIWGWTYTPVPDDNSLRTEISLGTIESHAIVPSAAYSYGHSGMADKAEGVSAEIELWAVSPDIGSSAYKICTVSYVSPRGSDDNSAKITWTASGWSVRLDLTSDFSPTSGPLGPFSLTVKKE